MNINGVYKLRSLRIYNKFIWTNVQYWLNEIQSGQWVIIIIIYMDVEFVWRETIITKKKNVLFIRCRSETKPN